ncbi:uL13 family ribosomal protein [Ruminococcus flavefaciens]|uniref:uL13 family ribosomal protein n=1 Tax=Ruminococcus flavefaciens TaxID=1265 RepID=UPI0026ECE5E0|nr:uL13 family ribosomal protein [Ruminococcus flavefaciens]
MREYLFSLVKKTTDLDMAKSKSELAELVPLLEKYTYEEIRAMKNKIKKDVDDNAEKLKGQIEEKERDIQLKQAIEVSDLELQKNSLKEQIENCIAKQTDNDKLMAEQSDRAMTIAIEGMLPNNTLGRAAAKRLRVYKGAEHKNAAQKPVKCEL